MVTVTLSAIRLYELATVVDSVELKDLGTVKDIRLTTNLVKDLKSSCKEFSDKSDSLNEKQFDIIKGYRERFETKKAELDPALSEEERKKILDATTAELDKELQIEIKSKFGEEQSELNKLSEVYVSVELADDKHKKLKELFEKYGHTRYLKKEVYLQVADVLGITE